MYNPSQEWMNLFDSHSPLDRKLIMAKLAEDWGRAMAAIAELMIGGTIVPVFNRDGGIMLPGQVTEMAIYSVFLKIRQVRFQYAKLDAVDYKILELEQQQANEI